MWKDCLPEYLFALDRDTMLAGNTPHTISLNAG
jgi:hypothetical protein